MIDNEEYDSNKHCCRLWYKDFCECTKNYSKRKVSSNPIIIKFLTDNNINVIKTSITNIYEANSYLFSAKSFDYGKYKVKINNHWKIVDSKFELLKLLNENNRNISRNTM